MTQDAISPEQEYATFEQLAVGVVHSTLDGAFLNVNAKFCELSGYTHAEALTLDIGRVTHSEDLPESIAARARMLAGEAVNHEREVRVIRKGGTETWARVITSLIRHADGRPRQFIALLYDIAPQKRAEQERREAELRFRQVTENIHEVFWLTDPLKNELLYVSPRYQAIWGRSAEALYSSPWQWIEAIHPDDRERVLQAAKTKQIAGNYDEEYRIVRPDGSVRWIRDRAFPVRGDDLAVIRVAGIAEDVTERKRANDELRESERRFSEILRKVQLLSVILDRDARIAYCNDYLLQLTGWAREEVLGKNWFDLFIPREIAQELQRVFASLLADLPEAWHHENEILTRSGELRVIQWNNITLRSLAGEVTGTASIGEDVTERKRAEGLRARLAAIVESTDDAIIGKTLDGVITSWNSGAEKLLGYRAEEAIGLPLALIVPPQRMSEELNILERLRRGERITHFETVRRRKDGSLIDVSLTISPILDAQGRVVGASKIARDITDRLRLERAVLEAADDERRRLGHDLHDGLGQELTGLALLAASLESSERRAGTAAAQTAATIERVARQALATCRSVARGLSPLGSGTGGLVKALEEMVALQRETAGIDVRFEATNPASLRLPQAVGDQLYRIAQEAVTNARRHASATHIWVTLSIRDSSVRLEVRDDGVGFATRAPGREPAAPGMGLRIMQFRAGTIGALLSIGPAEHGGTLVTCECAQPVPSDNADPSIRSHAEGGH